MTRQFERSVFFSYGSHCFWQKKNPTAFRISFRDASNLSKKETTICFIASQFYNRWRSLQKFAINFRPIDLNSRFMICDTLITATLMYVFVQKLRQVCLRPAYELLLTENRMGCMRNLKYLEGSWKMFRGWYHFWVLPLWNEEWQLTCYKAWVHKKC